MTNKTILRISLAGFAAIICMAFFLTAFSSSTASDTKPCKESMDESCKNAGEDEAGTEAGFQTLSGKFFSSASY